MVYWVRHAVQVWHHPERLQGMLEHLVEQEGGKQEDAQGEKRPRTEIDGGWRGEAKSFGDVLQVQ